METTLLQFLYALHPIAALALVALGGLVVLAQAYIAITPTQKDDAWFAKLEATPIVGGFVRALVAFAPIQRKELPSKELPKSTPQS